jgi:transcriptional regulator with GAF, ATPase, and Fis domain
MRRDLASLAGSNVMGADFGLRQTMDLVRQVAPQNSPVLLLGETGTGKEVIANAIHQTSPRRDGPIVRVQCGAVPDTLLDAELFGHEEGAFTGAVRAKRGRFERADGGTIFLDEIAELSPDAQVKLLRVLQEKEFERLGGDHTVEVDVRVIAATHRDLEAMVADGRFRQDLWYTTSSNAKPGR